MDDGQWRVTTRDGAVAIHSREPHRQAEREAAALLQRHPDLALVAVVGIGLGFLLDALDSRGWKGRVLALEPEPDTLQPLLSRRDWRDWIADGRLRLLVGPEFAGASDCRSLFGDGSIDPMVLVNPTLGRLDSEVEGRARAVVRRLRSDARANADARKKHGARYLLNTLENVRALATEGDVAALKGAFNGVPAIVVGAGPSLDAALETLRRAQEDAVVITVDTALRPLLGAGIAPHFVVALDPGEANVRHLCDLPPSPQTWLVTEASMTPVALDHFRGRTFFFSVSDHQPWPWLAAHSQSRGRLRAWGSVLTAAYDLALQLGCNPIVFAGSDLAFTGHRPYARGVAYEEDWRRLQEWGVSLESHWQTVVDLWPRVDEPDVSGASTRTAAHLVTFRNWLVEQIGREHGRTIINATGAGILHGGRVQLRPLDEVAAGFAPTQGRLRSRTANYHRPVEGDPLVTAAQTIVDGRGDETWLSTWEAFADGLTRDRIIAALRRGLGDNLPHAIDHIAPNQKAIDAVDAEWLAPLATNLPLVWFPIPSIRMEAAGANTRMFRSRTTAARMSACTVRMPSPAVTEDGRALKPASSLEGLTPGEYFIWRDEVHFRSTDGSDPRDNGRTYAVLMPRSVAYLEQLPLDEVLKHRL